MGVGACVRTDEFRMNLDRADRLPVRLSVKLLIVNRGVGLGSRVCGRLYGAVL